MARAAFLSMAYFFQTDRDLNGGALAGLCIQTKRG
jgi:hypothetical protein